MGEVDRKYWKYIGGWNRSPSSVTWSIGLYGKLEWANRLTTCYTVAIPFETWICCHAICDL
eukprot:2493836-Prymnesium_polylepis.1